jgi:hypothetical protein
MTDVHAVAVTCLAFSADGRYLASVGADADHTVVRRCRLTLSYPS